MDLLSDFVKVAACRALFMIFKPDEPTWARDWWIGVFFCHLKDLTIADESDADIIHPAPALVSNQSSDKGIGYILAPVNDRVPCTCDYHRDADGRLFLFGPQNLIVLKNGPFASERANPRGFLRGHTLDIGIHLFDIVCAFLVIRNRNNNGQLVSLLIVSQLFQNLGEISNRTGQLDNVCNQVRHFIHTGINNG